MYGELIQTREISRGIRFFCYSKARYIKVLSYSSAISPPPSPKIIGALHGSVLYPPTKLFIPVQIRKKETLSFMCACVTEYLRGTEHKDKFRH